MISEWTPGEKIICKKNPNYKGGWDNSKIVTEQLTFLLLEDSAASYAAYTSGQALMIKDVPTEEIPSLKKAADGGDFYVDTNLGTYYLSMNNQKAPSTTSMSVRLSALLLTVSMLRTPSCRAPTPRLITLSAPA